MFKKFKSMLTAVLLMTTGLSALATSPAFGNGGADADLSTFILRNSSGNSSITISPSFSANTTSYTASTDATTVQIQRDVSAQFFANTVNLCNGVQGDAQSTCALNLGSNTFAVRVTNGQTQKTYTITITRTASGGGGGGGGSLAGLTPLFASASSNDGRFTAQVTNYNSAFTYAVTSSAGQASIDSTGLVTVTGLGIDQSVSVTVTTTRTGYSSASGSVSGRSQVAPMAPSNKPDVTIADTLITCTIGSYSATPTSSAFSLFVDGVHISTNFSALGEYLPDWIIPWATSSTITRTASLTSASWALSDAYKGKKITCATLAYSKNAIGLAASQVLVAR